MRKLLIFIALFVGVMTTKAVPAHRAWQTFQQPDGSVIELMLVGDEHFHYYLTRDGVPVVETPSGFTYGNALGLGLISSGMVAHEREARSSIEQGYVQQLFDVQAVEAIRRSAAQQRQKAKSKLQHRLRRDFGYKDFTGAKKGLIILAEFSDRQFSMSNAQEFYNRVANEEGFREHGAPGSVHDYFYDMSRGKFDLTFDVVGPVQLSKSATYYGGKNDGSDSPYQGVRYADEMVKEACTLADNAYEIDWSSYDWDGDGEVEEVFIYYAGYGQATGGSQGTIWPHMGWLSEDFEIEKLEFGGMKVDVYACANELYGRSSSQLMGLGTFCHEFSHCLGFPDMYDTSYSGNYGMGEFDIMDAGNYNGPQNHAWCPAGYTSWERYMAGWLEWDELQPNDTITAMRPLTEYDSHAYVIYNDAFADEYYLIENRSKQSWDAYIPQEGVVIIHVDYDKALFDDNIVNTEITQREANVYGYAGVNDHERMSMFKLSETIGSYIYSYVSVIDGAYPLENRSKGVLVDSLTDNSSPAATLYNNGPDGTKLMHKPIYDISYDSETKNASFVFMPKEEDELLIDGISRLTATNQQTGSRVEVYTLTGNRVAEAGQLSDIALTPGIYLVRSGSESKKITVK